LNVAPAAAANATAQPMPWFKSNNATTTTSNLAYTTMAQTISQNPNDFLAKKLDDMLAKVEAEFGTIRRSIGEIKEEMCGRWEEAKRQVETVENKVNAIERKVEDFSLRVYTIIQNICTSMLDPKGSQGDKWKSYWQDQVNALMGIRSSGQKLPEG
jgi:hypothetical protein